MFGGTGGSPESCFLAYSRLINQVNLLYGRASVITGDTQVSVSPGFAASPNAFRTVTFTTYRPLGTTSVLLPLTVVPSHVNSRKPVLVAFRWTQGCLKTKCQALPEAASNTSTVKSAA